MYAARLGTLDGLIKHSSAALTKRLQGWRELQPEDAPFDEAKPTCHCSIVSVAD